MVQNPALEDLYYLSIIFNAMKGLFEIKLQDPLKEFYFIHEIISQTPNHQNLLNKSTLQNRFFEILNFTDIQKSLEIQHKDISFILIDKFANIEKNEFITKNFSKFNEENIDEDFKKDAFFTKKSTEYKKEKIQDDHDKNFLIDSFKKEALFKVNYFNIYERKNFLKDVRLSIEFFKEKPTDFQKKINEKIENNIFFDNKNKFLPINDFKAVLTIKTSIFEEKFLQVIKDQIQTIANNKIEELIPFAVIGYHFKESEKNNMQRRKKKKKKVLFKREIKYLKENF